MDGQHFLICMSSPPGVQLRRCPSPSPTPTPAGRFQTRSRLGSAVRCRARAPRLGPRRTTRSTTTGRTGPPSSSRMPAGAADRSTLVAHRRRRLRLLRRRRLRAPRRRRPRSELPLKPAAAIWVSQSRARWTSHATTTGRTGPPCSSRQPAFSGPANAPQHRRRRAYAVIE